MGSLGEIVKVVVVGIGATIVMDVYAMILKAMRLPTLDYALVGRWAGHLCKGKFAHASIIQATPVQGERLLGWAMHYAVGIMFAVLFIEIQGVGWLHAPTWLPALVVGTATVVFSLCVMQPAMGAGFAASRTAAPVKNCMRSLLTHVVFGYGLYLTAVLLRLVWA